MPPGVSSGVSIGRSLARLRRQGGVRRVARARRDHRQNGRRSFRFFRPLSGNRALAPANGAIGLQPPRAGSAGSRRCTSAAPPAVRSATATVLHKLCYTALAPHRALVLAYDFKTGKRVWETTIADINKGRPSRPRRSPGTASSSSAMPEARGARELGKVYSLVVASIWSKLSTVQRIARARFERPANIRNELRGREPPGRVCCWLDRIGAGPELGELRGQLATLYQLGVAANYLESGPFILAPKTDGDFVLPHSEV